MDFHYGRMAQYLGANSLLWIACPRFGSKTAAARCTEEMATDYIREMPRFSLTPLLAGGRMRGGIVAYEDGAQLLAQGQR